MFIDVPNILSNIKHNLLIYIYIYNVPYTFKL